jgi:hypothetical protein
MQIEDNVEKSESGSEEERGCRSGWRRGRLAVVGEEHHDLGDGAWPSRGDGRRRGNKRLWRGWRHVEGAID